jgi:hypothetical protein
MLLIFTTEMQHMIGPLSPIQRVRLLRFLCCRLRRAFKIANRLTLTKTSIKKTPTAATMPAEKPEKWKDSEAKAVIRLDIISKRSPAIMTAKEVYAMLPE